jgi:tetratricopeptide (TPR) repeat protein
MIKNVLTLLLIFTAAVFSGHYRPVEMDSLLRTGKEQIYQLKVPEAAQTFQFIKQQFPDMPQGYVLEAYLTALVYSMDQSNDSLETVLLQQVNHAVDIAETYRERNHNNPEAYFYLAIGNGVEALYHVINRSFVKGYFSGRSTKKNLEKAIELDPRYFDAYFGLGVFHYYADLLPGMLKFIAGILGFEGDRIRGRNEVYMAASKGEYFRIEGEFIYYTIGYFLEGEKTRSIRALKQLYQRYPSNSALGMILAYHYRRTGHMQECISYCQNLTIENEKLLPQLTNMKYYNMAVANYCLNNFETADSIFHLIEQLPTRKSRYYRAAINYYLGHIADLRFDRKTALAYYQKIPNEKQERYWYLNKRMHERFPMDSLQYRFFIAENLLDSRQLAASIRETDKLMRDFQSGQKSTNPMLPYLVANLSARQHHYRRNMKKAGELFDYIYQNFDKIDDEFQQSWILIHYGRYLRDAGDYDRALQMFQQAGKLDDDFTKIICEREKFVTQKQKTLNQTTQNEEDD